MLTNTSSNRCAGPSSRSNRAVASESARMRADLNLWGVHAQTLSNDRALAAVFRRD
jgi:hypothetical protein